MSKKKIVNQLEKLDMRPGRGLGQNFLTDRNLLDFIIRSANITEGERIVEVGPGLGALTYKLLETGAQVTAIEFDRRLAEFWRRQITEQNVHNFALIEGDACNVPWPEEFNEGTWRSVANLPYAASSVYIARLIDLPNPPSGMVFMLQKEMGMRLAAGPGVKNYGALSVRVQQLFDVEILRIVPPEVFHPAPEVDSAIVAFKPRKREIPPLAERKELSKLVKVVFLQRRKQMRKVLKSLYPIERIDEVWARLELNPCARPEELSVAQFEALTEFFSKNPK